jgi:hypothetical protein
VKIRFGADQNLIFVRVARDRPASSTVIGVKMHRRNRYSGVNPNARSKRLT